MSCDASFVLNLVLAWYLHDNKIYKVLKRFNVSSVICNENQARTQKRKMIFIILQCIIQKSPFKANTTRFVVQSNQESYNLRTFNSHSLRLLILKYKTI